MDQADLDVRFWNRLAQRYAANPVEDVPAYERTLEVTRTFLGPDKDVFEFGCGTGTTALKLAADARHILATDFSGEMIAIATEKGRAAGASNVTFAPGRPDDAWPGEAFDVAIAFNVLHLIADRKSVFEGVRRLLKPGGCFISKTPCLTEMGPLIRIVIPAMRLFGKAPSVQFFSAHELEQEITGVGFEIILNERHGTRGKDNRPFIVARKP